MVSLEDIYNSKILDLAANIPRTTRLSEPDASATAHSKLCGSTITVDIRMEGDRIADFGQTVKACLLGQSSASIMGRHAVGATASDIRRIAAAMRKMLKDNGPPPDDWEELKLLEPVRAYKARHASTLLVFDAVEDAIGKVEAARAGAGAAAPA